MATSTTFDPKSAFVVSPTKKAAFFVIAGCVERGVALAAKQAVFMPRRIAHTHNKAVVNDLTAAFAHFAAGHLAVPTLGDVMSQKGSPRADQRLLPPERESTSSILFFSRMFAAVAAVEAAHCALRPTMES